MLPTNEKDSPFLEKTVEDTLPARLVLCSKTPRKVYQGRAASGCKALWPTKLFLACPMTSI